MTKNCLTWIGSALTAVALLAVLAVGGGGTQAAYGQSDDLNWGYCLAHGRGPQTGTTYFTRVFPIPSANSLVDFEEQFEVYVERRYSVDVSLNRGGGCFELTSRQEAQRDLNEWTRAVAQEPVMTGWAP